MAGSTGRLAFGTPEQDAGGATVSGGCWAFRCGSGGGVVRPGRGLERNKGVMAACHGWALLGFCALPGRLAAPLWSGL
ncbi:MAG: hypothetical protein RI826_10590, partial [Chlorobium phaeovibrioides]|nr:hypothetical protein [Chlorobium phaeovibrioides]